MVPWRAFPRKQSLKQRAHTLSFYFCRTAPERSGEGGREEERSWREGELAEGYIIELAAVRQARRVTLWPGEAMQANLPFPGGQGGGRITHYFSLPTG